MKNKLQLFAFLIGLLLYQKGLCQGIYEIKYKYYKKDTINVNSTKDSVEAVMFYYGNNNPSNVVRTRFLTKNSNWVVIEQNVRDTKTLINGKMEWVIAGYNPKFIEGNSYTYNPDIFKVSKEVGNMQFGLDSVYDTKNNGGRLITFNVLEPKLLSNDYLVKFNWNPKTLPEEINLSQSKLHIFLVSDTQDSQIGAGCLANHNNILNFIRDSRDASGITVVEHELKDADFRKNKVVDAIQQLNVSDNDIIIFYYSGHGLRQPNNGNNKWPTLKLKKSFFGSQNQSNMDLVADIYKPLVDKKSRLLLVIGDCCNITDDSARRLLKAKPRLAFGDINGDSNSLKALFSYSGKGVIASSSPGEFSYYYPDTGGFFCEQFLSSLKIEVSVTNTGDVNWSNIILRAVEETKNKANLERVQFPRDMPTSQTPTYELEI
ncbi:hypothetical protein GCM10028808_40070 [Spirosoma migulaei]